MKSKLTSVHGNTTDGWSNVKPAAPPSLAELPVLVVGVAGHANRGAGIFMHPPDLAALELHIDVLARHDFGTILPRLFLLGYYSGVGSGASAEDSGALGPRSEIVYHGSHGNEMDGKAVSAESSFRRQDTRINDATHAVEKVLGNARAVTLDDISRAHAVGSNNIRLPPRGLLGNKGDMGASARVVLDTVDNVRTGAKSVEIDGSNPPLSTTSPVPYGNLAARVSSSLSVALLGDRQG